MLIINADDWGRDPLTTDRIHDCLRCGAVSAVSAMVFMEDSERAANLAREGDITAGLHLNFTTGFTGSTLSSALVEHHARVSRYLLKSPAATVVYHPGLPIRLPIWSKCSATSMRGSTANFPSGSTGTTTCTCPPTCFSRNCSLRAGWSGEVFPSGGEKSRYGIAPGEAW